MFFVLVNMCIGGFVVGVFCCEIEVYEGEEIFIEIEVWCVFWGFKDCLFCVGFKFFSIRWYVVMIFCSYVMNICEFMNFFDLVKEFEFF